MIVRINRSGRSFAKLASYLERSKDGSDVSDRLAWTHTLNCANDHVPSAVHEMYNTYLDADLLKEEAGVRSGGRRVGKPVAHISLSWHPDEKPTREQMIAAAESYLDHIGAGEHQAILVAHNDRPHQHVHIELNRVHPITGLTLDNGFDKVRSQQWAAAYEREHGRIFCEQREMPEEERESEAPRPSWRRYRDLEQQQAALDDRQKETGERQDAAEPPADGEHWRKLKEQQREERKAFFAEGKDAYRETARSVGQEIREEFRAEWSEYYSAKKAGVDAQTLLDARMEIGSRQDAAFKERCGEACADLRKERDVEYAALLAEQKIERVRLTAFLTGDENAFPPLAKDASNENILDIGQADGSEPATRLNLTADRYGNEAGGFIDLSEDGLPKSQDWEPRAAGPGMRDSIDAGVNVGLSAMGGVAEIAERLFDGFFGQPVTPQPKTPPKPRQEPESRAGNPFAAAADEARRRVEQEEADTKRANDWWDERRARARE